jgi:ketosteroid isomerase-like protein
VPARCFLAEQEVPRVARKSRSNQEVSLKHLSSHWALVAVLAAGVASAQEADHAIHEELRMVMRGVTAAMSESRFDDVLPYLTENVEATSITQEVMSSRADVSRYFNEWFGPGGYMRRMKISMDVDRLTELSADKSWGLVRGKALEHYEAKDGDLFDFITRWTAVMVRSEDGKWRIRAIHFGTNNLDNPVLDKVKRTLVRDGIVASIACLVVGALLGWWLGRRRARIMASV